MPLTVEQMLAEFQGNPPSERAIIEIYVMQFPNIDAHA
jgi:hypothetical protein